MRLVKVKKTSNIKHIHWVNNDWLGAINGDQMPIFSIFFYFDLKLTPFTFKYVLCHYVLLINTKKIQNEYHFQCNSLSVHPFINHIMILVQQCFCKVHLWPECYYRNVNTRVYLFIKSRMTLMTVKKPNMYYYRKQCSF